MDNKNSWIKDWEIQSDKGEPGQVQPNNLPRMKTDADQNSGKNHASKGAKNEAGRRDFVLDKPKKKRLWPWIVTAGVTVVALVITITLKGKAARNREEVKNAVDLLNEYPINYNGFGDYAHFECDNERKTIIIDFKLNNEYLKVSDLLNTFTEDAIVGAGVDVVRYLQKHVYIDWAEKGYNVDLSIYDDLPDEEMRSSLKWGYTYDRQFLISTTKDLDFAIGLHETLAQLIVDYYVNIVLSSELPKRTRGPWRINRICYENDYVDVYYECTEKTPFNIFYVEGEDEQKLLAGGEYFDITNTEMALAFAKEKMVWVGGEPLFALDFLYQSGVSAHYHFEPFCTIDFKNK